jgi:hypothetical protein
MIQTPQIQALEAIGHYGEVSSQASTDVFSQKVGDWAFSTAIPTTYNEQPDVPNRFSYVPEDGNIMDFIESHLETCKSLPIGHLYDSALESVANKVTDPVVKQLLEQDVDLRYFLRSRRMGEVYE